MARILGLFLSALLLLAGCGESGEASAPASSSTTRASGFTDAACADLIVVAVRGQQQSPDKNYGAGTEIRLLATELTRLVQARSDTTVRLESIDYESNPAPDLQAYQTAVAGGSRTLDQRLDRIEADCSDSRIAVIGFSMGAQVVHESLADRPEGHLRLVALIADPLRDPVADYVQATFGTAAPNPGSLGAGPLFTDLSRRVITFCAPGDDVCNHSAGASRRAVDTIHKHYYEQPEHVATMAARMLKMLRDDSGS